jgi:hypothetical protein
VTAPRAVCHAVARRVQVLEKILTDRPGWREGWAWLALALYSSQQFRLFLHAADTALRGGDAANVAVAGTNWLHGDVAVVPDAVLLLCAARVCILHLAEVGVCAVLCCAVLCCAVLCCAVLCCAVLCCAVLCCAVLCCVVIFCGMLCCALCLVQFANGVKYGETAVDAASQLRATLQRRGPSDLSWLVVLEAQCVETCVVGVLACLKHEAVDSLRHRYRVQALGCCRRAVALYHAARHGRSPVPWTQHSRASAGDGHVSDDSVVGVSAAAGGSAVPVHSRDAPKADDDDDGASAGGGAAAAAHDSVSTDPSLCDVWSICYHTALVLCECKQVCDYSVRRCAVHSCRGERCAVACLTPLANVCVRVCCPSSTTPRRGSPRLCGCVHKTQAYGRLQRV